MKRIVFVLLTAALCLGLTGCDSIYDSDYLVIEDYVTEPQPSAESGSVTVSRYTALKSSILKLVLAGEEYGKIVLDANYSGDVAADFARACWELRTQNAVCAYCVDNIAYELNQIVTYYEAEVTVSYAENRIAVSEIESIHYAYGLRELIRNYMEAGSCLFAAAADSGYYSEEDVESIVESIYYESPSIALKKPVVDVMLYGGTGGQKLYEIAIDCGEQTALDRAKERLSELEPFGDIDTENADEETRAFLACSYLTENCTASEEGGSSVYSALLDGEADSFGVALGYVELCGRLGIKCRIVQGEYNWAEHFWNIVEIDGEYFHVDVTACINEGMEQGFMINDAELWGDYRWNVSTYPNCTSERRHDFRTPTQTAPAEPAAEPDESIENEAVVEFEEPAEAEESPSPAFSAQL